MWKNFTDRIRNTDVHGVFIKPKTYTCICSLNDVGGGSVIWWSSPNCRQSFRFWFQTAELSASQAFRDDACTSCVIHIVSTPKTSQRC